MQETLLAIHKPRHTYDASQPLRPGCTRSRVQDARLPAPPGGPEARTSRRHDDECWPLDEEAGGEARPRHAARAAADRQRLPILIVKVRGCRWPRRRSSRPVGIRREDRCLRGRRHWRFREAIGDEDRRMIAMLATKRPWKPGCFDGATRLRWESAGARRPALGVVWACGRTSRRRRGCRMFWVKVRCRCRARIAIAAPCACAPGVAIGRVPAASRSRRASDLAAPRSVARSGSESPWSWATRGRCPLNIAMLSMPVFVGAFWAMRRFARAARVAGAFSGCWPVGRALVLLLHARRWRRVHRHLVLMGMASRRSRAPLGPAVLRVGRARGQGARASGPTWRVGLGGRCGAAFTAWLSARNCPRESVSGRAGCSAHAGRSGRRGRDGNPVGDVSGGPGTHEAFSRQCHVLATGRPRGMAQPRGA